MILESRITFNYGILDATRQCSALQGRFLSYPRQSVPVEARARETGSVMILFNGKSTTGNGVCLENYRLQLPSA